MVPTLFSLVLERQVHWQSVCIAVEEVACHLRMLVAVKRRRVDACQLCDASTWAARLSVTGQDVPQQETRSMSGSDRCRQQGSISSLKSLLLRIWCQASASISEDFCKCAGSHHIWPDRSRCRLHDMALGQGEAQSSSQRCPRLAGYFPGRGGLCAEWCRAIGLPW